MSDQGSPIVRRRLLAGELRRLRERIGYNGDQAADRLGWSASKLSRIENNKIGIKEADVRRLLDLYRVPETHREELLALARESHRTGRIEAVSARLPQEHAQFLPIEAEAESVWNWEPQVVPGLLQTEDYARAVMLGWRSMFPLQPREIDRRIEARQLRQRVLERDPPLRLSFILDESVLHRKLGDKSMMRRQLEHIIEVSRMPHVTVRVLPLNGDHHPVLTGAFTYITFPKIHDVHFNDIATLDRKSVV